MGVPIDGERTDLTEADFEEGSGSITIAGELSLDFVPVRCVANIDLSSLKGQGRLEPLEAKKDDGEDADALSSLRDRAGWSRSKRRKTMARTPTHSPCRGRVLR